MHISPGEHNSKDLELTPQESMSATCILIVTWDHVYQTVLQSADTHGNGSPNGLDMHKLTNQ